LTRKTRYVMISIRIGAFAFPIILPLRCAHEITEGYLDLLSPFKWISEKVYGYVKMAEGALMPIKDYEPLDLVDIDIKHSESGGKTERFKVKIITR
jgi:hypothetical protein